MDAATGDGDSDGECDGDVVGDFDGNLQKAVACCKKLSNPFSQPCCCFPLMMTMLSQHARSFAEGVLKSASPDSSEDADASASSLAAAAAAAVNDSLSSLCRNLDVTEPQSVADVSLSLHFADSADVSQPHFTATDVSASCWCK